MSMDKGMRTVMKKREASDHDLELIGVLISTYVKEHADQTLPMDTSLLGGKRRSPQLEYIYRLQCPNYIGRGVGLETLRVCKLGSCGPSCCCIEFQVCIVCY